jgi:hypothetical protein
MAGVSRAAKNFSHKRGQYLAFIHLYTRLHRQAASRNRYAGIFSRQPTFGSPLLTLERAGLIRRQPRVARSIEMLIDPNTVQRY